MIKVNKLDKFVKENLVSLRAKGMPIRLDQNKISVGNTIIRKLDDETVRLNDPRNDQKLTMNFMFSALLLAKHIHDGLRPNTSIWNRILEYDRKLAKYSYESSFYANLMKKTKDANKKDHYHSRLDHCQQAYMQNMSELNQLNKWDC